MQLDHHLVVDEEGRVACRKCGHGLGGVDGNFKEHTVCKVRPIQEVNR